MAKKEPKTNAMRMLERAKIPFEVHRYECKEFIDGITIADMLNEPYERVFKTLVTEGKGGGYIRGGCTAIGMKKDYPTVLDESANAQEKIIVSGGKNGIQIELTTEDYLKACKGKTADITLR